MNDKDQAAIDHVASVSKHPHAAMIVKWLITGWDVKWKGSKGTIVNPAWVPEHEYELIAKSAYRVYTYQGTNSAKLQNRFEDGSVTNIGDIDKVEFLSDWIEYDSPKGWPTPLVERIASIDIKAAEWIVDHWDDLLEDKYTMNNIHERESNLLNYMFYWYNSPQGEGYWKDISRQLNR